MKSKSRFDIVIVWPDGCRSQRTSRKDVEIAIDDVADECQETVDRVRAYQRRRFATLGNILGDRDVESQTPEEFLAWVTLQANGGDVVAFEWLALKSTVDTPGSVSARLHRAVETTTEPTLRGLFSDAASEVDRLRATLIRATTGDQQKLRWMLEHLLNKMHGNYPRVVRRDGGEFTYEDVELAIAALSSSVSTEVAKA